MRNQSAVLAAFAGLVITTGGVVACGSTTTVEQVPAPAATDTAPTAPTAAPTATTPVPDNGAVSTTYPAFPPAMPQVVNQGGKIQTNPVIVTVTFPGETNADLFESIGDTIGGGTYWTQITGEYGVNAATSGATNHVRLTDAAPATIDMNDIGTFVQTNVTSGTFPAVTTGDPIYIVYFPSTTSITDSGQDLCQEGIGGWHDETTGKVVYAVVPQCGYGGGYGGGAASASSVLDETTLSASHELAEATLDPYPNTNTAYYGYRDQDLGWAFAQEFQMETGDSCEFIPDLMLPENSTDSALAYATQRQWSNKQALAGHDPCVPINAGNVYYNTTPLNLEDVDLSNIDLTRYGITATSSKGFTIAEGATKTIPIGFYSDAAFDKPWTISAATGGAASKSSADLDLKLDVTEGMNGQKANLTVTVNTAGRSGLEIVTITSTFNGNEHTMPILIVSPAATTASK